MKDGPATVISLKIYQSSKGGVSCFFTRLWKIALLEGFYTEMIKKKGMFALYFS